MDPLSVPGIPWPTSALIVVGLLLAAAVVALVLWWSARGRLLALRRELSVATSQFAPGAVDPRTGLMTSDDFEVVLVVRIAPNIEPLNGDELATRAILSARTEFGSDRKDGISYLIRARDFGIETPLQSDYEAAILRGLDVTSLSEAWDAATSTRSS